MARIITSIVSPINFIDIKPGTIAQYVSKHMDDALHAERLVGGQHTPGGPYLQPWQFNDVVSLQWLNNAGQIHISVIDCSGKSIVSFDADQKQQNAWEPEYYIYEANIALTVLPGPGDYWIVLRTGSGILQISEPLRVEEVQPRTLLFEYSHPPFYQDFIFATGMTPSIRVGGMIRKKPTASKDTIFEDQVLDMVMVKSRPYRIWELILGVPGGIPDWMEDKLGYILGCRNLKIDGRYYTKNEGAKLEEADVVGYGALAQYRIELRESITRNGKVVDTDALEGEELSIVLNTTSKGFGDTSENASSSVVQIFDVE